jgi:predicted transcriptional regulator
MKLPCETAVWYLLPVVKSELAKELSDRGMSQKKIAEVIDVTQAAVSQYISKKRGSKMKLTPPMKAEIRAFALKVINGKADTSDLQKLICAECECAKKAGVLQKFKP